jgi:hypothetical protein
MQPDGQEITGYWDEGTFKSSKKSSIVLSPKQIPFTKKVRCKFPQKFETIAI